MTRSKRRKVIRERALKSAHAVLKYLPATTIAFAGSTSAFAQEEPSGSALKEIVVTAQKREENLQNVPISVQALDTEKLEQMNVKSFDDYAKLMPSLSFQTIGPGYNQIIIRGVSSGGTDFAGPQSTVATYLDEQPVTTNEGTMDVHIYDIARIEVLSGPQGTLYGASAEAGTLRVITNQPDLREFKAAYDVQGSDVAHGGAGDVVEGFVNIPLSSIAAVRLVGWQEFTPGYINDVAGTRVFPVAGACIANFNPPPPGCVSTPSLAHNHYNDVQTTGGRATLKLDLDETWTITPVVMGQDVRSRGYSGSGFNPLLGNLNVAYFYPQRARDSWFDTALTIEGKLSNLDIVYAGAFLKREQITYADYSDYSLAYDSSESQFITDNAGKLINPSQRVANPWYYQKWSHELRVSTPKERQLRFVGGLFVQRQQNDIENRYEIANLAQALWVPGYPDTWWLTKETRVDRDSAVFGELSYDILPNFTVTGGLRFFKYTNTQEGFYGLSGNTDALLGSTSGVAGCFAAGGPNGVPCTNLDGEVGATGHIPKVNLAYHITASKMVYATWAKGFRPGGINRIGTEPDFKADFLTSYEVGWKTSWAEDRVRFNGAIFDEEWKDFQFSFTGQNGVSLYANAGQAEIKGLESSLEWAVAADLTLSGGLALMNPKLTENYCGQLDANGNPITNCAAPLAPAGTQLPGSPKFKGNVTARYLFHAADFDAHVQGSLVYQASTWPDLRLQERGILGKIPAYAIADFTAGLDRGNLSMELFVSNAFDRRAEYSRYSECAPTACGSFATYVIPVQPRTVGLRFGQKF